MKTFFSRIAASTLSLAVLVTGFVSLAHVASAQAMTPVLAPVQINSAPYQISANVIPGDYQLSIYEDGGYGRKYSSSVKVTVSKGKATFSVPSRVGKSLAKYFKGGSMTVPVGTYQIVLADKYGNSIYKQYVTVPAVPAGTYYAALNGTSFDVVVTESSASSIKVSLSKNATKVVNKAIKSKKAKVSLGNHSVNIAGKLFNIYLGGQAHIPQAASKLRIGDVVYRGFGSFVDQKDPVRTVYAGNNLNLEIKAIAPDGKAATPDEGYNVQVLVYDRATGDYVSQTNGGIGANATYQSGYWYFNANENLPIGDYYMDVIAYCSRPSLDYRCGEIEASRGSAQVNIRINFSVTSIQRAQVTLTSPNGGESFTFGNTIPISWKSSQPGVGSVSIYLRSEDTGKEYVLEDNTQNNGYYLAKTDSISVPGIVPDRAYRIGIWLDKTTKYGHNRDANDVSDSYFKIYSSSTAQPSIKVISPNGGEQYTAGQGSIKISYITSNMVGQSLDAALYSPTLGLVRRMTVRASKAGTITMSLEKGGADAAGPYKIMLCALSVDDPVSGKSICDSSDMPFIIASSSTATSQSISVKLRDGSQLAYQKGDSIVVPFSWSSTLPNKYPFAYLLLADQSNSNPEGGAYASAYLSASVNETGGKEASLGIPFRPIVSGVYKIVVCDQSTDMRNPSCGASGNFTIIVSSVTAPATVSVVSPNGGEVYSQGQAITVRWKAHSVPVTAVPSINLVDVNGVNAYWFMDAYCGERCTDFREGRASFWLPEKTPIPTGQYKIRVACVTRNSETYCDGTNTARPEDVSDAYFTILAASTTPPVSTTPKAASVDLSVYKQTTAKPVITGSAQGTAYVGIVLSSATSNDKVYGSGLIPVINGRWSVQVVPALAAGAYRVTVYDEDGKFLTSPDIGLGVNPPASITILTPNGGDKKGVGETIELRYNQVGLNGVEMKVSLVRQGQENGTACLLGYTSTKSSSGITRLTLGPDCINAREFGPLTQGEYKLMLYAGDGLGTRDTSDRYFSLVPMVTSSTQTGGAAAGSSGISAWLLNPFSR